MKLTTLALSAAIILAQSHALAGKPQGTTISSGPEVMIHMQTSIDASSFSIIYKESQSINQINFIKRDRDDTDSEYRDFESLQPTTEHR